MRRRSKETFKKEYALFKGGYEEFGKLRENPAIGTTSHRVVDKVLGELQARASLLDAINKEYEKKIRSRPNLTDYITIFVAQMNILQSFPLNSVKKSKGFLRGPQSLRL